jgi:hypothetical protein
MTLFKVKFIKNSLNFYADVSSYTIHNLIYIIKTLLKFFILKICYAVTLKTLNIVKKNEKESSVYHISSV